MKGEAKKAGPAETVEITDEVLMARYQKGDDGAFSLLLDRHGGSLLGFLTRMTGSPDKAEDAYQEVFLKVVKARDRYKPDSSFTAWLFTIARNVAIDMARKEKYRRGPSLDATMGEEGSPRIESVPGHNGNPEEKAAAGEMARVLEEAIAALPEEQREVFLLREKAGLPYKEVARITGAPLNTVKTRMHYALNQLRKSLSEAGML